VMSQYGMADAPGRFDHWGVGLLHTFPNEGSAQGTVVISPGDIINTAHWESPRGLLRVTGKEHMIIEQPVGDREKVMFHTIALRTEQA